MLGKDEIIALCLYALFLIGLLVACNCGGGEDDGTGMNWFLLILVMVCWLKGKGR